MKDSEIEVTKGTHYIARWRDWSGISFSKEGAIKALKDACGDLYTEDGWYINKFPQRITPNCLAWYILKRSNFEAKDKRFGRRYFAEQVVKEKI